MDELDHRDRAWSGCVLARLISVEKFLLYGVTEQGQALTVGEFKGRRNQGDTYHRYTALMVSAFKTPRFVATASNSI